MSAAKHRARRQHFLKAWLRSPLKVGALLPSSRALAKAMAAPVNVDHPGMIVELGAGTGMMTHALLEHGIKPSRLLVVEREENLHAVLCLQFPELNVLRADAARLDEVLAGQKVQHINAIVSSLPLLAMPQKIRSVIEQQMLSCLGDDSVLVQFTYGARSPIPKAALRKHHLFGRRVKTVLTNIPPAHVWVYRRERRKIRRH